MTVLAAAEQPFGHLSRQVGKMFEQMRGYSNFVPGETWTPAVNLYETDTAYLVCVDLAGVDKDKIDLIVEGQLLKIKGTRAVPSSADGAEGDLQQRRARVHLMEIDHGGFSREVELPQDVVQASIEARYLNGLLWIEIPKK